MVIGHNNAEKPVCADLLNWHIGKISAVSVGQLLSSMIKCLSDSFVVKMHGSDALFLCCNPSEVKSAS